jgi:hypothetical protein
MDMLMSPQDDMSVGTMLTRLEDRMERRFDRVEEKLSTAAKATDLKDYAQRTELDAIARRLDGLEERSESRELVKLARNNWPWIVALLIFLAANWQHIWRP